MEKVLPLSLIATKGGIESLISLCSTLIEGQKKGSQSRFGEHLGGKLGGWMLSQGKMSHTRVCGSLSDSPPNKSFSKMVRGWGGGSKLNTEQLWAVPQDCRKV